jgi:hypothetical protein
VHYQAGVLVGYPVGAPAVFALGTVIERRIGDDVVGFDSGELVVAVGITHLDVAIDTVNEKIHPAETVGEILALLPDKGKLAVKP